MTLTTRRVVLSFSFLTNLTHHAHLQYCDYAFARRGFFESETIKLVFVCVVAYSVQFRLQPYFVSILDCECCVCVHLENNSKLEDLPRHQINRSRSG